jgi:hypothetical protein
LFGVRLEGAHGHDLLPLARGQAGPVRAYACSALEVGGEVGWALRTPAWALLSGPARLYVRPDDRWEVNDVSQHHPELVEGLERTLRDFVAAAGRPGPLEAPALPEEAADV